MANSYLSMIVLYCLHRMDGQRTIYSILHLLNGKKSAQTIQDAHFFQLTKLFNTFSLLNRSDLEQIISALNEQAYISRHTEQSFQVTSTGVKQINDFFKMHPIPPELNGWRFHNVTELFWERISLAIQVISQLRNRESKYVPIQKKKELHQWLKTFLYESQLSRDELAKRIYDELVRCLETNNHIDPAIFVKRLTGFQIIGLTEKQAAWNLDMDEDAYHIQFLGILHYMLEMIETKQSDFPLLRLLIADKRDIVPLTQSSNRTFDLLKKGYSLEEITHIRNLKKNTIEDHIVEIALNVPDFDISTFVNKEKKELILIAVETAASKQLKHIRELVPNADYFEIRLVMARGW